MECMIIKVHAPVINTVYHCTFFASSSSDIWLTFQAKNNGRSASVCTALTEAIMYVPQIVTYMAREKGTKVSFDKP